MESKMGTKNDLFMTTLCGKCGHKIKRGERRYPLHSPRNKMLRDLYQCAFCYFDLERADQPKSEINIGLTAFKVEVDSKNI